MQKTERSLQPCVLTGPTGEDRTFRKCRNSCFWCFSVFLLRRYCFENTFLIFMFFFNIRTSESTQNSSFFEKVNRITHTLGKSFPKSCCFCVNILCFSCFLSVHKCLQSCMFCEKIGNPPYRKHLKILQVLCFFRKYPKPPLQTASTNTSGVCFLRKYP